MCVNSNTNSFICNKCNKSRSEILRHRAGKSCKVCEAYRTHCRDVATPKTFNEFETYFFERQRLNDAGLRICPKCSGEFPKEEMKRYGCEACHKEYRRLAKIRERTNAAIKAGKKYTPMYHKQGKNTHHGSVVEPARKNIAGAVWYFRPCAELDRRQSSLAEWNAVEALRLWLKEGATDEYVMRWFDAMGKPWLNPRLSSADKFKLKYTNDPVFHVKQRMRMQFRKHLVRCCKHVMGIPTPHKRYSYRWDDVLDYSASDFITHMESLFDDGMTWQHFFAGQIHIDHIKPISLFDLNDIRQVKECFSLSNLQPLWAIDNIRKSNKYHE